MMMILDYRRHFKNNEELFLLKLLTHFHIFFRCLSSASRFQRGKTGNLIPHTVLPEPAELDLY